MNTPSMEDIERIPGRLRAIPRWTTWHEYAGSKVPTVRGGKARPKDTPIEPTLDSFDVIYAAAVANKQGIGFYFADDDIIGVDLDDCIDDDGVINEPASLILRTLKSYAEITPSKHGLHIIIRGKLPDAEVQIEGMLAHLGISTKVEVYAGGAERYFTFTGDLFGSEFDVEPRQTSLDSLCLVLREHNAQQSGKSKAFVLQDVISEGERNLTLMDFGRSMRWYGFGKPEIVAAGLALNANPNRMPVGHHPFLQDVAKLMGRAYKALSPGEGQALPDKVTSDREGVLLEVGTLLRTRWKLQECELLAVLQVSNTERCIPALPEAAVVGIAKASMKAKAKKKPQQTDSEFEFTEAGNAKRFIADHAERFRYCPDRKLWLAWDGKIWKEDEADLQVSGAILLTTEKVIDGPPKWYDNSQSSRGVAGVRTLARGKLAIAKEKLDSDRMLLTCANCTIDLKTGTPRDHRQADFITRMSRVDYQPDAKSELWERFLHTTFAGPHVEETIAYVQRAFGYTLTGNVSEKALFFLHGTGDSGKTTLSEVFAKILGSYATTASFDLFLTHRNAQHPTEVARLSGPRMVKASEVNRGGVLDGARVKSLTGNDGLTGRGMHENFRDFEPHCKFWLAANDAPKMDAEDAALWNRIHVIPCINSVPESQQDKALTTKLCSAAHAAAVLAWAVEGCREWQRIGLARPSYLKRATQELREESDDLNSLFEENLLIEAGQTIEVGDAYRVYRGWAMHQQISEFKMLTKDAFGRRMARREIESKMVWSPAKKKSLRMYLGLGVRGETSAAPGDLMDQMHRDSEAAPLFAGIN